MKQKQNQPFGKIAIIGSGFGGLATACLLSKKGYKVDVYEKNEQIGGRASQYKTHGYTFDMGPSWYLMPDVFEHFFKLIGENLKDHITLTRLSPSYRIFFAGKEDHPVDIYGNFTKDVETLKKFEPELAKKLKKYLKKSELQYNIAIQDFLHKNYDSITDFFTWDILTKGIKLSVFSKMDKYVKKHFSSDELQKIMQYTLVFLGSSPYNTPALYNIMSHVDFNMGVFYPQGGFHAVAQVLAKIAQTNGTTIKLNSEITKINVTDTTATTLTLQDGSQTEPYDAIISNADMQWSETQLLEPKLQTYPQKYWDTKVLAPSALILYLGINKQLPQLDHHNLYFSENWQHNFAQIFDTPALPDDPSYYICNPNKSEPGFAPEGKENLFVLVPLSSELSVNQKEYEEYADKIIDHIGKTIGEPIKDHIEYQKIFTGSDFSSRYHSFKGSALGLAHTLNQTAIFRPNNVSKKVTNLYYVGGTTNPGIGVPICLVSAQLVYKRLHGINDNKPLNHL